MPGRTGNIKPGLLAASVNHILYLIHLLFADRDISIRWKDQEKISAAR